MHEFAQKIKWLQTTEVTTIAIIVLVGFASFGLGRLSALQTVHEPVRITSAPSTVANIRMSDTSRQAVEGSSSSPPSPELRRASNFQPGGKIVGSKNGTKYHFPWCAGAQRIKEENKRWFDSVAAARTAGYSPAGNCKGLE
jgi:hypothetical protein